jgi:hypothetical protein
MPRSAKGSVKFDVALEMISQACNLRRSTSVEHDLQTKVIVAPGSININFSLSELFESVLICAKQRRMLCARWD